MAQQKRCTPSQLALAWVLARGEDIVPIPGNKKAASSRRNCGGRITLTKEELARIDEIAPAGVAAGERYPAGVGSSRAERRSAGPGGAQRVTSV